VSFCAISLRADDTKLILANHLGVAIEFSGGESSWRWTKLFTPPTPEGWTLSEGEISFGAGDAADVLAPGWELIEQTPVRLVFEKTAPASAMGLRRIFSLGPASNVVRVETWAKSLDRDKLLNRVGLVAMQVEGEVFRTTGSAPASFPVFGEALFAGIEHVTGESGVAGDTFRLSQTPDLSVGTEWQFITAFVMGWHVERAAPFLPGESRTREAFLHYLDSIRVRPADINLHSDTWWTLPLPFSEGDVLRDIEALRKGFFERTGMFFNTYALDLGWSDPRTLWGIDARNFPQGFGLIQERLAEMNCRPGLWVSPSSAYEPGLDNRWLDAQGYETTTISEEGDKVACFALGGRYQREFAETITRYAKDFSLGHVIFDGLMHSCDNAAHLHGTGVASVYSIDAGFKDVMDRLRRANPNIILEPLSCGHPPSPWWNVHTPFLLGPAGDDVPYGRVPCPDWTESLVSARDIAYRASQEKWLVRTQALETFDLIVQSPGVFQNMAVMAAGRGRWFMSANFRPELMQPTDWDFLAALVRWQRANKGYLTDALMIGGDPGKREAYGYMFHHADRDLYCIRNPWIEARTIRLPARVKEARDVRTIYPRRGHVARIMPDDAGVDIVVGPYETLFLQSIAAGEDLPHPEPETTPRAELTGVTSEISPVERVNDRRGFVYRWSGTIETPDVRDAELSVLVEGPLEVANVQGTVQLNGRPVQSVRNGSAGQFGAAADPSPENWVWLRVPLTTGQNTFDVAVNVPLERATVGIFLRGSVTATNDDAKDEASPFPLYQPEQRPWSQTLQPLTVVTDEAPDAQ
jgi:hypothetical protein